MKQRKIGLSLSGGGFRAAVFHIGVLTYLAEKKQLENITYISTVSGGSLLVGLIYSLNNYKWPSSHVFLTEIEPEIKKLLIEHSLMSSLIKNWIFIPSNWKYSFERVRILSYTLKHNWQINASLSNISKMPIWTINATTAETGKNWRFTSEKMGDYVSGYVYNPDFKIADIMAISAGFPIGLGPYTLRTNEYQWSKFMGWSTNDTEVKDIEFKKLHLYDGGVYDNLGTEPMLSNKNGFLREEIDYLIVSDASMPLSHSSHFSIYRGTKRLLDINMDQVRSLRARILFNEFSKNSNGLYLKIGHSLNDIFSYVRVKDMLNSYPNKNYFESDAGRIAKKYPTDLKKMTQNNYQLLKEHGRAVADATSFAYNFYSF